MNTNRLGRVAQTISGVAFPHADQGSDSGDFPFLKVSDLADPRNADGVVTAANWVSATQSLNLGVRLVPEGAIIFPKVGAALLGNARRLTRRACAIDNNMMAVLPNGGDPRYWLYSLMAVDMGDLTHGGTIPFISDTAVRDLTMPCPPTADQRRIADFLDVEVARIDQIIDLRIRQSWYLVEEFKAAGDRIVTGADKGGVHANWAPFGRVPSRWTETRLSSVPCTIQTGPFGSQLHSDEYIEDGWPVVNPASLRGTKIVPLPGMTIGGAVYERLARHHLKVGDVVFGRRGELGRAGLVSAHEAGWVLGTGSLLVRLSPSSNLRADYLVRLLETAPLRHYFDSRAVGSTMANLNSAILNSMPLLLPPPAEQERIVSLFADLQVHHETLASRLSESIELLHELRQSLIKAAVSGEFDVSTADGSQVGV